MKHAPFLKTLEHIHDNKLKLIKRPFSKLFTPIAKYVGLLIPTLITDLLFKKGRR